MRLTRMVKRRERIDDRYLGVSRELFDQPVIAEPRNHAVDIARKHDGRVAYGLSAAELKLVGAEHQRVAAKLRNPDLERDTRSSRGLVEEQRDGASPERLGSTVRNAPSKLARTGDHGAKLDRRNLLTGNEVPR